jgi:hypothetical protein
MNQPTSNNPMNDFDDVSRWMAEAGDPRVEPRPEHVEQLRALLLDRLGPPRRRTHRLGFPLARWLVAACFLIAAGLGTFSLLVRPVNAWARVAQALQDKAWIHIVSRGPNAPLSESWISPALQILAEKYDHGPEHRGAELHDLKMGIKTQYVAGENTIYRLPEAPALQQHNARELMAFEQILRGKAFQTSPIPDTEIIGQKTREVAEGGKTWTEYELTVRWKASPDRPSRMWWRVDPETNLPSTWDIEMDGGKIQQTIDYPGFGPSDILALGVPSTAKLVDRIPNNDLNQILTGLKIGRNRFDDYCGYVWGTLGIHRVWRKGHKWRVERGLPRITTKAAIVEFYQKAPNDVDLAGWKQREKDIVFETGAIFDGQTIWHYNYNPKQVMHPDQPYTSQLQSVTSQPVTGAADDPMMPWPHLMPEQLGHPSVYVPDSDREFLLDPKPGDGPPNTVRLRVRNSRSKDPQRPDLYRLWIDLEKNYLSLKSETSVFERGDMEGKIAFVDTYTIADLARSPSGFWYPTRVLRKTSNFKGEQVTRFALDFQTAIPDSLFEYHK